MAAGKQRKRQRRRRGRYSFLYKMLSFLIIFTALLVGCVVFFRVNRVTVTGVSRYTEAQVVAASGVEIGDNLLLINKPQTVRAINRQLPYVESVTPVKRLPDTLELRVTETVAAAALPSDGSWWLMDARGKLVERGDESLLGELPQIMGVVPVKPTLGAPVTVELADQPKLEALKGLLTALKKREMGDGVTGFIDLHATSVIYFAYGPELTVAVPVQEDYDGLALRLQRTLEKLEEMGERAAGTLDLTYGDDQARLLTERYLPESLRPQPEPAVEPSVPPEGDEPPAGGEE